MSPLPLVLAGLFFVCSAVHVYIASVKMEPFSDLVKVVFGFQVVVAAVHAATSGTAFLRVYIYTWPVLTLSIALIGYGTARAVERLRSRTDHPQAYSADELENASFADIGQEES
jgi:predicted membrane protein